MNRFGVERQKYIGASQGATAVGASEYSTPRDLWLEKTGRKAPQEHKKIFDRGHTMESIMIDLLRADFNRAVTNIEKEFTHSEHSFLKCHVDGIIPVWQPLFEGDNNKKSGSGVLEMKAPSSFMVEKYLKTGMAVDYLTQGQMTLACTGLDWVSFVFLDYNNWELVVMDIDRNQKLIDRLILKLVEFWGYVERDEMPPEEVEPFEMPELISSAKTIEPTADIMAYVEIENELKLLKSRKEDLREAIRVDMNDHEKVVYEGVATATNRFGKPKETIASKDLLFYAGQNIDGFNPEPFIKKTDPKRTLRITPKK